MSFTRYIGLQNLDPNTDELINRNVVASLWGLGMVLFGCLVLNADIRHKRAAKDIEYTPYQRDIIFGMEQRYFCIVMHGFLLYISLMILLSPEVTVEA